jgi:hypothetical protein
VSRHEAVAEGACPVLIGARDYLAAYSARLMPNATARHKPRRDRTDTPSVVDFRQEGTIYDVPIDVLWEFMNWEGHGAAHEQNARNTTVLEESPNGVLYRYETQRGGDWRKITGRVMDFPPLGRVVQEVEGPYKGTQMVFLYTPVAGKTRLDIVARFVSDQFDPPTLKRHMVDSRELAAVEDDPYLQRFLESRNRS